MVAVTLGSSRTGTGTLIGAREVPLFVISKEFQDWNKDWDLVGSQEGRFLVSL